MNELTREQVEHRCKNVRDIGHLAWEAEELLGHDAALRTKVEVLERMNSALEKANKQLAIEAITARKWPKL